MTHNIAIQLYSVRDLLSGDFAGVVTRIARMGYKGVEPAGFPGIAPAAAGKLFRDLGLVVTSLHIFPPPVGSKFDEAMKILRNMNCQHIVSGYGPDQFKSLAGIERICDEINGCYELYRSSGIKLSIHNHWWEYQKVDGIYPYQVMMEKIDPEVSFEVDTYWVKVGGCNPITVLQEMGMRARLIHVKDGPGVKDQANLAVGSGVMDFAEVINITRETAEWYIVEFDRSETDILEAVEKSYQYLETL
jgi:sugar phosphate isomerase/epimerase